MSKPEYDLKKHPVFNLDINDLPGEKWADIPGFWDRYAISNFGRVKSLFRIVDRYPRPVAIKERILKLRILKKIYTLTNEPYNTLHISLRDNYKKKHNYVIGRMVYFLFVENFDEDDPNLYIGYIDNDPFNLHYKNLKLGTRSETQLTCYSKPQRWRPPAKVISQYNYNGDLIRTYDSITEAARLTNTGAGYIGKALNGRFEHCKGSIWRFGKRKKIKPVEFPNKWARRVAQYSLDNQLIRIHDSISKAWKETGFSYKGISAAAQTGREQYRGYIWRYIDN